MANKLCELSVKRPLKTVKIFNSRLREIQSCHAENESKNQIYFLSFQVQYKDEQPTYLQKNNDFKLI